MNPRTSPVPQILPSTRGGLNHTFLYAESPEYSGEKVDYNCSGTIRGNLFFMVNV
jgi:hypothetical protein